MPDEIQPKRFDRIRRILKNRPDSEHEMTLNRLVFATVVLLYLKIATFFGSDQAGEILSNVWPVFVLYYIVSFYIFFHIIKNPGISPTRRVLAIFHDLGMISYTAAACGLAGGFMYPLFLWTIFGNGFRFGVRYLYIATAVSLVGFAAVVWHLDLLNLHPGVAVSLGTGLIILPLYVSVLIRKLSTAKQQAEEANRAKSLFLASVTHELRTPLNAIIGLSGILRARPREREEAEIVRTIERSGRLLLSQINSILNLSRIEAGRMPNEVTEIDIHAMTSDVRSVLRTQAKDKGLRLGTHISARTPRRILTGQRMVEELLINLTANAVKFTREGYVVIGIDAEPVDETSALLKIEVIDTGVGIDPKNHEKIFESFTQADETVINEFGGSGLGLSICKQLVELNGGRIGVESAKGSGSRFWVELPVSLPEAASGEEAREAAIVVLTSDADLCARITACRPDVLCATDARSAWLAAEGLRGRDGEFFAMVDERAPDGAELVQRLAADEQARFILVTAEKDASLSSDLKSIYHSALALAFEPSDLGRALAAAAPSCSHDDGEAAAAERPSLDGLSILVAEDNKTNQMVITKILESAGGRVVAVGDGERALEAIENEQFDVVLMDLNMPNMDGIEAAQSYAVASSGRKRVPIIALTADATEATKARCLAAGMSAFATKPIETAELLSLIAEVTQFSSEETGQLRSAAGRTAQDLNESEILKVDTLSQLERLGGRDFVQEIVTQFLKDVDDLLPRLSECVAGGDWQGLQDNLHAFRSCAANAGAERIFSLCLMWRGIDAQGLESDGDDLLDALGREVQAFKEAYRSYEADGDVGARASA